jgi:hypothetical protein
MPDAMNVPTDENAQIVAPPLVDHLYLNADTDAYIITLVPDDRVSRNQKEIVTVSHNSEDGKRVELRLSLLSRILGAPIVRLFHAGGGDFGFLLSNGREVHLAEENASANASQEVYDHLQDLGMIAQIAFRQDQLLKRRTA